MNKDLTKLVERLERAFPHLKLYYEGEIFLDADTNPKHKGILYEPEFAPPKEYTWFDIIKILDQNGLEIRNKK